MALRYQADTQTKPLGANANTPLQGNTAFKDGQLAEVILLITGRFTVGEGYNGIHKLFQQLRHRFAVGSCPASKSIQCFFFAASSLLVAIFTVGTKPPYGVPRPVLNSTIWQPAPASALVATASLPGALSKFRP